MADGQMSFVFFVDDVCFSGFSIGLPVLRSTPVAQLTTTNGSAMSSSPVFRSSMYAKPLRSKFARTFLGCPLMVTSTSTILVDPVVVPAIVRGLLVRPLRLPGVGVPREDRHRPLVVAGPLIGIPGSGVAGAVVEQVELRVVAVPAPRRAAAPFPLIALPGFLRTREADFRLRPGAVHAPDLLAGLHVVGRDKPAHAELSAADAGDDLVFDHERRGGDGLADSCSRPA